MPQLLDQLGRFVLNPPPGDASLTAQGDQVSLITIPVANSAGLTAALTRAGQIGGANLALLPGTYTGNFILPANTIIDGGSPTLVTITQPNGANSDVVQGINFLTLTGKVKATGDYLLGCHGSGLRNVTVDGNKAGNASGWPVRLWGCNLVLENVETQNGPQGDLWTEFTDIDSFSDPSQKLEGRFYKIRSSNSNGDGWTFRGPHDSIIVGMSSYNHAQWAFTSDSVAGSYQGSVRMWEHNSFLCTAGDIRTLNSGSVAMYGGSMTGANVGTGFSPSATSGSCKLIGVQVSGRLIYFDLKAQNHQIIATIANVPPAANSDIVKLNGCSGCQILIEGVTNDVNVGSNCNLINSVTDNLNQIIGIINGGLRTTPIAGTLNAQSRVDFQTLGSGGNTGRMQVGPTSTLFKSDGYSPILPQSVRIMLGGGVSGPTYSASISIDPSQGALQKITATDGNPFTINAPGISEGELRFEIVNGSGGVMGAITWNAIFHLAGAFTNPAAGKARTITFYWDGAAYIELCRAAADI